MSITFTVNINIAIYVSIAGLNAGENHQAAYPMAKARYAPLLVVMYKISETMLGE